MNDNYDNKGSAANKTLFFVTALCCITGGILLYASQRSRNTSTHNDSYVSDQHIPDTHEDTVDVHAIERKERRKQEKREREKRLNNLLVGRDIYAQRESCKPQTQHNDTHTQNEPLSFNIDENEQKESTHIDDQHTICEENNAHKAQDENTQHTEDTQSHTEDTQQNEDTQKEDTQQDETHIQEQENTEQKDEHRSLKDSFELNEETESHENHIDIQNDREFALKVHAYHAHVRISHTHDEDDTHKIPHRYVRYLRATQSATYRYTHYSTIDKSEFLETSYTKLQQALVYIYNIERRIHMGILIDDDAIAQYKQAHMILYEYVLYDSATHLQQQSTFLRSPLNVFEYSTALQRVVNTYILTTIKNAAREIGETHKFVEGAYRDLHTICETVKKVHNDYTAPYVILNDSVIRFVPSEQYDITSHMSHTALLFHSATLAEIYNTQTHVNDICIYLNIGKVLHKHSVVNVIYNEKIYANIRYMPMNTECLRTCLLPYFMNYSARINNENILVGYLISIAVSPQEIANIHTDSHVNVYEIYDHELLATKLLHSCIAYVSGNIQQIEKFSDFKTASRLLKYDIYDVNNLKYMYETFKDYTGMTVCTQYTKGLYGLRSYGPHNYPKVHLFSSSIKFDDIPEHMYDEDAYNEYNVPQNIPFGSVVIKTCLEIIESYFNLIVNSEHVENMKDAKRHEYSHADEIYRMMCIFIDAPEKNMYDAHKYDIRNAYTKVMGCVFHVLHTHKEHILHTLIQSYKSVDKEHFVKAYEYLQSLKVIIVQTDTTRTEKTGELREHISELSKVHSQYRQHIQQMKRHIPFGDEHIFEDIMYRALLSPNYALRKIMSIQNKENEIYKLQQDIYNIVCEYINKAPLLLIYEKYQLHKLEHEGKHDDSIIYTPVCRRTSRKYDYALEDLHTKIQNAIKKHELPAHDRVYESTFRELCMSLGHLETQYDAKKLLAVLVCMDDMISLKDTEVARMVRLDCRML